MITDIMNYHRKLTNAHKEFWKTLEECGFDHLNMTELRKNYDKTLDKSEEIELLGFKFIKY